MGSTPAAQTVSVVIPTRGRPELVTRAASSALQQTQPPLEVIVVIDGPDPATETALATLDDARLKTIALPESGGAAAARNAGVTAAQGRFVAFLDDDDLWLPEKLANQLGYLHREHADRPAASADNPELRVLGTAASWHTGDQAQVWPTRAPRQGESIGEYLFVRDHPGEGALATPTVLLPTALAQRCPMPTTAAAHEEWAWFLDLQEQGARFEVLLEPLVEVDARPRRRSLSAAQEWRTSLDWAIERKAQLGDRAFSGFVLTEVARAAVLGHAPPKAHLQVLRASLTGRPRVRDLLRAIARPLVLRRRANAGE